jgi:hypothetical protein
MTDYKKRVLENQEITIIKDYNRQAYDWEIGNETSANGYDLWYVKEKLDELSLCDNVYTEEYDMLERVKELIEEETNITIVDWEELTDNLDWEEIADSLGLQFELEDEDEIVELWVEEQLPMVKETYEQDGQIDTSARRESFNNWTDQLCKDGRISTEMYNNIDLPEDYEN